MVELFKRNMLEKATIIVILLFTSLFSMAQEDLNYSLKENKVIIYFRFSKALIEKDYQSNNRQLQKLDSIISGSYKDWIDSIQITSSTSPDGSAYYNQQLTKRRSASIVNYLKWKHPTIDFKKLVLSEKNHCWEDLKLQLETDSTLCYKEEVLAILKHTSHSGKAIDLLKSIDEGRCFDYLAKKHLRKLRNVTSIVIYKKKPDRLSHPSIIKPSFNTSFCTPTVNINISIKESKKQKNGSNHLLAIKTNLLFDLSTALNLELELPIAKHWSVAAEWIFPWWTFQKNKWVMHIMHGNLETRYWFRTQLGSNDYAPSKHKQKNSMQGWFIGLYAGGGVYDLLWENEGIKGNVFSTGLTGGYALPLNPNMGLEFSLGMGYLQTNYEKFRPKGNCLVWQSDESLKWVGLTRAKISLIWNLSFKRKHRAND